MLKRTWDFGALMIKGMIQLSTMGLLFFTSFSIHAGIYDAKLQFFTEEGKKVTLSEWNQKVTIMSMAYTSCKGSCPVIIKKLRTLDSAFKAKGLNLQFLIVTFDPETDTPAKLKDYRNKTDFHESNFTFLVANTADTRKFSMQIGLRFSKDDDGSYMHDNKIVAVSKSGKIIAEQDNLNQSFDDFISKVIQENK